MAVFADSNLPCGDAPETLSFHIFSVFVLCLQNIGDGHCSPCGVGAGADEAGDSIPKLSIFLAYLGGRPH